MPAPFLEKIGMNENPGQICEKPLLSDLHHKTQLYFLLVFLFKSIAIPKTIVDTRLDFVSLVILLVVVDKNKMRGWWKWKLCIFFTVASPFSFCSLQRLKVAS